MFKHRLCHQQMWFDPAEREGQGLMKDYVLVNHWFSSASWTQEYLERPTCIPITCWWWQKCDSNSKQGNVVEAHCHVVGSTSRD